MTRQLKGAAALALQILIVLSLFGLIYRVRLAVGGTELGIRSRPMVLGWLEDVLVGALAAVVIALAAWLAGMVVTRSQPAKGAEIGRQGRAFRYFGWSCVLLLLSALGLIYQAHGAAVLAMGEGLTATLLDEMTSAGLVAAAPSLIALLDVGDLLFIIAPAALLLALRALPSRLHQWLGFVAAGGVFVAAATLASQPDPKDQRVSKAVRRSPVPFVLEETWFAEIQPSRWPPVPPRTQGQLFALHRTKKNLRLADDAVGPRRGRRLPGSSRVPFAAQLTSVQLEHPLLASNVQPKKTVPARTTKQWNVLFVLMESTGLRYAFDDSVGGKQPMPFLAKLAAGGLQLTNHFSPSNSSPRSIFSLVTGLYPMPTVRIYSMNKGLHFPSLFTMLPGGYDTFLITPAPLTWYFPRDFMSRNGPREIHDYTTLPIKGRVPKAMAKDEAKTVGFFLDRLDRVGKRPFFAIYYSFVAHWPYPDYGPRYRRYRPTRKLHRYLNNLYLLDTQIERMVNRLKAKGRLENTILVIVGDHGEAFGQHKGNWTHSRHSFNENYQTPAVLYQPALFSPRKITVPTSHVDIAPTLLDAMGIAYNPKLFQGESLFQDVMRRRYVFLFGNENTLSSVGSYGPKLQLSFRKRRCWVYDLKKDPNERRRLGCKKHARQNEATVLFARTQPSLLRAYNASCKKGRPFHGQRHPARVTSKGSKEK